MYTGAQGYSALGDVMVGEGRLLWFTPLEWSVLLISTALCGCLTLLGI